MPTSFVSCFMLTPTEKAVGRHFLGVAQAALLKTFEADPPTYTVPNVLALYRHACPKRQDRSTALELKEIYLPSRTYGVMCVNDEIHVALLNGDSDGVTLATLDPPVAVNADTTVAVGFVPAGRFGFITRAGKCRGCGQTARSKAGRLVDGWERPPIQGRVARS